jgi:hypothetical protein
LIFRNEDGQILKSIIKWGAKKSLRQEPTKVNKDIIDKVNCISENLVWKRPVNIWKSMCLQKSHSYLENVGNFILKK